MVLCLCQVYGDGVDGTGGFTALIPNAVAVKWVWEIVMMIRMCHVYEKTVLMVQIDSPRQLLLLFLRHVYGNQC